VGGRVEGAINEIMEIPELLDLLSIEGATVTLDAMGCRGEIAVRIRERGADCVLNLKANRGNLHDDVKPWFDEREHENVQSFQSIDGDRGVIETRTCTRCDDIGWPGSAIPDGRIWPASAASSSSGMTMTRRPDRGRGTSSRPWCWTRTSSPTRCARTGRPRTASTGCST